MARMNDGPCFSPDREGQERSPVQLCTTLLSEGRKFKGCTVHSLVFFRLGFIGHEMYHYLMCTDTHVLKCIMRSSERNGIVSFKGEPLMFATKSF